MADPDNVVPDEVTADGGQEEPTSEEPSSQGEDSSQPAVLASELMRDPIMLAALQDKLGSMVGGSSGYIQSLPKPVKRRIKALKKIQFEATKIEAEFYREVHRLECEYATKYAPIFEKRGTVVTGNYEPNDEEADWPSDDEKDEELVKGTDELACEDSKDEVKKTSLEEKTEENAENKDEKAEDAKGIPSFWLTIFKNVDMLSEMIQPHDEPILNHLQDIKVEFKEKDPMGFTLEFIFDENEYFENKKITKAYVMRSEPEKDDPFSFEGPEIIKCSGCKIDWKKGKNVTVKTVKKKQKHKASGTTRTIQKTVQSDSFFNFFSPPTPSEDEEMDEDTEALLAADFEIGHFIRERIVPRAVLYFTGEALENEDDDDYGEEEEGEEGDYDEDGDPDYSPGQGKFITREFQARCALLALGRQSVPSSAPCDTQLRMRPSSGSAIRSDMVTQTGINSRPSTAPYRTSLNVANQDMDSKMTRPDVNTQAFGSSHNVRDRNVAFEKKNNPESKALERALLRESTEIFLPNALQAEELIDADDKYALKLEREKTFISSSKGSVHSKAPVMLSREKSFIKGPGNAQVNPQKKKVSKHLDSVDECSYNEEIIDPEIVVKDHLKTSSKPVGRVSQIDKQPGKEMTPNKLKSGGPHSNASNLDKTKMDKSPNVNTMSANSNLPNQQSDVGNRRRVHVHHRESNNVSGTLNKRREPFEKNKTKDTAFNMLKKLTGKNRQSGHTAGQVPNVSKPRRRYKFTAPAESPEEPDIGFSVQRNLPHSAGTQHKYSYKGQGEFKIEAVHDNRPGRMKNMSVPGRKESQRAGQTASAPARNSGQRAGQTASAPARNSGQRAEHTGNQTDGKIMTQHGSRKSAEPDKHDHPVGNISRKLKQSQKLDLQADEECGNGSEIKEERSDTGSLKHAGANRIITQTTSKFEKTTEGIADLKQTKPDFVPSASKRKGVKIQNAMISTSIEVSDSLVTGNTDLDQISNARGSTPSKIHPKLQDSPYLKDNQLLQSGKQRRRHGASSAHSHVGADGDEHNECNCDLVLTRVL